MKLAQPTARLSCGSRHVHEMTVYLRVPKPYASIAPKSDVDTMDRDAVVAIHNTQAITTQDSAYLVGDVQIEGEADREWIVPARRCAASARLAADLDTNGMVAATIPTAQRAQERQI